MAVGEMKGRNPWRLRVVTVLVTGLVGALVAPAASAQTAAKSVDMKVLVVAADGNETDLPAITGFLDQVGQPYDVLVGTQRTLTADLLSDTATHGRYNGIVLTTGNLVYYDAATGSWPSAFTADEWATLRAYQTGFGVRSVTSYTFPEAAYGLSYAGFVDTLGTKLPATLTDAGKAVWPYINDANPIPLSGAWVYLGDVIDPTVTTPLVNVTVNGQTYPVASVTKYDGYENLTVTVANNPNLVHSLLLSTGWINWVTRGNWMGNRSANMDLQIDDLFNSDDVWNTTTNAATDTYRNTAGDITALVNYQNARRADPTTPGYKVEFAYNGGYASANIFRLDALTRAVVTNRNQFRFINHTSSHFNFDCGACENPTGQLTTTASRITREIATNALLGALLGLPQDTDTLVQPDISGINTPPNPMAQKTNANVGIRYWIGDTSRPGTGNPSFNVGFPTAGDSRLYVVPRRPTNLFVAASTPDQWVGVYNSFYAPGGRLCAITTCFDRPQTYAEILDHESDYLLRYWLQGDLDPIMFHQPNIRAYDGVHSVMSDLVDASLAKYKALVKSPIRTNTFKQAGQAMQSREAFNRSGVTATVTPCQSITLKATKAATVPVNGVSYTANGSTVASVGGRTVSNVKLAANTAVTIPLPAC